MQLKKQKGIFALFCMGAALLLAGSLWMGVLVVQNAKMYRDKSSQRYDVLSRYAAIGISSETSLDAQTQHALDLACLKLFEQTNGTALLCCPSDALLLYFNPINQDFSYKAKNALLATDHLLYVNNHYLSLNPILGYDGEPLSAPEEELAVTVLAPDNFPLAEADLQEELQALATLQYYFPEDEYLYGTERAAEMKHDPLPVHLVYYPAGQQAFLYHPAPTVHIHEALADPLLWVVTQGNADPASQTFYLTNQGYLPEIPAGTTAEEGLKGVLESSGLLAYVSRCYAYAQVRQDTLNSLRPVLGLQIGLFIVLSLGFLACVVQMVRRSAQGRTRPQRIL